MKYQPFKSELKYGLIFIILSIITGAIFNQWAWGFLLWATIYITWKWAEFYYFFKWYQQGSDITKVPLNTGIWEDLCTLVIQNKKRNLKIEEKNKFLLNQFNATAQALPYATVILNNHFEIQWINNAANQILGVIQNKDENNRIDNIIRDPRFVELLTDNIETSEIQIQHPLDMTKKIQLKLIDLSENRILLVGRDISEQESLRKSRKAFVDNASHELRTPLTVINGYLELLQNAKDIPSSWQAPIDQAKKQSNRMENIINDMLKLSSIEHERYIEDTHDVIEMPQLLNRLLEDVKNGLRAKEHTFTANIDSDLNIMGNEDEIISVCLNLLNNAIIHTQKETKIQMKWFKQNKQAHLWVCDNGKGIDSKHIVHLTERFYRIENSREKNKNSTGLGLAIVKQICINHNAKLEIESIINTGTCFKVTFPESRMIFDNYPNN
jgi:two-component system phosphate regulon sensor histidine kinase PhoR